MRAIFGIFVAAMVALAPRGAAADLYPTCDPAIAADCGATQVCAVDDWVDPNLGLCDDPPGWNWWTCDVTDPGMVSHTHQRSPLRGFWRC